MTKIRKNAAKYKDGSIKASVAEVPESVELKPYSIGFKFFDDNICVLKNVDPKVSRKVHEIYRNMGRYSSIIELQKLPHDIKRIYDSGVYTKYYSKVTDDVEVYEFDVGVCRGFFFCDDADRIIQMLAIDHHPENKKHKR